MEPTNNQPQVPTPKTEKKGFNKFLGHFLVIILSVGITLVTTQLLTKETRVEGNPSKVDDTVTTNLWEPLTSNKKGYAYIGKEDNSLQIWDLVAKKLTETNIQASRGGGSAGQGNREPLTSPDLLFTTYINNNDKSLWYLSHETLDKKQISPEGTEVEYITEWSPDSRYIVYYIKPESLVWDGMGAYEGIVKFKEQLNRGFMAFDTQTGKNITLAQLSYVETFVDDNKLLVHPTSMQDTDLVVFNIETFEVDFDKVKGEYGFGSHQFDFSPDGKNWTYTYSEDAPNDANIVYGTFPSTPDTMEVIDKGSWAEVQWPHISPDGTKLIYQHKDGNVFPGFPKNITHIVTLATGENEEVTQGRSVGWLDNNNIIVSKTVREKSPTSDIYMVDLTTGEEYLIGTEL